jgi:hypothetical protein
MHVADLVKPEQAVRAAIDVYGEKAPTAAAPCALRRIFDGRADYYRF